MNKVKEFHEKATKVLKEDSTKITPEELLKKLEEEYESRCDHCSTYKDSGDRGMCYDHEARPVEKLAKQYKELIESGEIK